MAFGNVLGMYNKMANLPFGKTMFSYLFGVKAPYFLTIRAVVADLKPGYGIYILKTNEFRNLL
jgi:acyl-coenzyme A thioesterase PaaI-like protein